MDLQCNVIAISDSAWSTYAAVDMVPERAWQIASRSGLTSFDTMSGLYELEGHGLVERDHVDGRWYRPRR